MTDERLGAGLGEGLWDALARLPRGSGVVFRHYATPAAERRRMFAKVVRVAKRRGLVVVRAGASALPHEGGSHNRAHANRGLKTFAVHTYRDTITARRAGAELVFVSPVFATRSHPGGRTLGRMWAVALARAAGVPAVALGGMDAGRMRGLRGFWGWAGVDAWIAHGMTAPTSKPVAKYDSAKPSRQSSRCEAGRGRPRDAD